MSNLLVLALAGVFLVSGIGKLISLERFRSVLRETYAMPSRLAAPASLLVPASELGVAVLLLVPGTTPVGLIAAAGLLVGISGIVGRAWAQGSVGECGCLGALRTEQLSGRTLFRVLLLLVIALVGLAAEFQWLESPGDGLGMGPAIEVLLGTAGLVIAAALIATSASVLRRMPKA